MKMSDILRDLAELLDQQQGSQGADMSQNSTQQRMTQMNPAEPELSDEPVMVPALQQKHELLKKVAGVSNAYDNQGREETGELDRMKKDGRYCYCRR
jgi:hypothetical protein